MQARVRKWGVPERRVTGWTGAGCREAASLALGVRAAALWSGFGQAIERGSARVTPYSGISSSPAPAAYPPPAAAAAPHTRYACPLQDPVNVPAEGREPEPFALLASPVGGFRVRG